MDRDALLAAVQESFGRTDKDSLILVALNLSLIELMQRVRVRAQRVDTDLSVSDGDTYVALSGITNWTDMSILEEAWIEYSDRRVPFKITTKKAALDLYRDQLVGGIPEMGYIEDEKIWLVPSAGEDNLTLKVTALIVPKTFATGGTDNPIPGGDLSIIAWATQFCHRSVGSFPDADAWMGQWIFAYKNLRSHQARQSTDQSPDFKYLEPRSRHDMLFLATADS